MDAGGQRNRLFHVVAFSWALGLSIVFLVGGSGWSSARNGLARSHCFVTGHAGPHCASSRWIN
jgi:hypothetical protein